MEPLRAARARNDFDRLGDLRVGHTRPEEAAEAAHSERPRKHEPGPLEPHQPQHARLCAGRRSSHLGYPRTAFAAFTPLLLLLLPYPSFRSIRAQGDLSYSCVFSPCVT